MKTGAIIVGAGKGERLGSGVPKGLRLIEGVPLILVAAFPFCKFSRIESVVLVVPSGSCDDVRNSAERLGLVGITAVVEGGTRRQDSVKYGLETTPENIERIMVHDGARPLLSDVLLERLIDQSEPYRAATVGMPVTDTLHWLENKMLKPGVDRRSLIGAQTPQIFTRTDLERAFELAENVQEAYTDEISLVRGVLSVEAGFITGEASNVKITYPDDLRFYYPQLTARVHLMKGR